MTNETVVKKLVKVIDRPHGKIKIVAVKRKNSTAVSDLYDTIAEIMVKQAIRESRLQKR